MKIGLFVDGASMTRWQAAALDMLGPDTEFVVYDCRNTHAGKRRLRNLLYYALNLFTIRNRLTRSVPLAQTRAADAPVHEFETPYEGAWQRLPPQLLAQIERDAPAVLLKFGLSLLRVPEAAELSPPILSYHHGDPRLYRGRPAGFYETLEGAPVMGQIVQILSNRLDAGAVVAFGETKMRPHSYRRTLLEAYGQSPRLLPAAIRNALAGTTLPIAPTGRNYRLPSNLTVARFLARLAVRTLRRFAYGLLMEKRWAVSTCAVEPESLLAEGGLSRQLDPRRGELQPTPPGYAFIADPFFAPGGEGLLVEALNARSGRGEILLIRQGAHRPVLRAPGHASYPSHFDRNGVHYLIPEISEWSEPKIYRLDGGAAAEEVAPLRLPGDPRILDPTLYQAGGHFYLFGNDAAEGPATLRLWSTSDLSVPFREHPRSPILLSPRGGRMAGALFEAGGRLFRPGQDDLESYGDGLLLFEIETITPDDYRERAFQSVRFSDVKGPHTLNFSSGRAVFDWYVERPTPLAGIRRLRAAAARRPPTRTGTDDRAPSNGRDRRNRARPAGSGNNKR